MKYNVFYAHMPNLEYAISATAPAKRIVPFSVELLPHTHAFVREVEAGSIEDVYGLMQGRTWSPNGEARPLIASLGLGHTSLSVGDVVQDEQGAYWMCADFGWKPVPESLDAEHRAILVNALNRELRLLFDRGAPFSQAESAIGAKMLALKNYMEASHDAV